MGSAGEALYDKIPLLPDSPGCYLYKDASGRVIYVGKAKNLRKRVASYFQRAVGHPMRTLRLVQEVVDIETLGTDSEVEALLLENSLIKDLQPRYNIKLKDDKSYPLLAVTREEFPRVFITRDAGLPAVDYYGPFVSAIELNRAYHFLQRVFRFRVCDLDIHEDDPVRKSFRPCLNFHIKRCSAPCTTRVGKAEYAEDIRALRAFVGGRGKQPVLDGLTKRMQAAAGELRFEDAARYRDQIQTIDRLKKRGRLRDYDEPTAPTVDIHTGMERLQAVLGLAGPPRVIEGFDIAHLQGEYVVASLVQFSGGVPNKDGYRRFRVRGPDGDNDPGNNDFAAMREVVGRRYRRLLDEGLALPDLVVIDGGHGQVRMAVQALEEVGVLLPCIVGLAKRAETIIRADGAEVVVSKRDQGLKLLMYVRDEAHRFCRRYFHLLQRKALEEPALTKLGKNLRRRSRSLPRSDQNEP
ncbi:MAG: excinuclease ABC subunit UvrC [Planctomycetes bacterium]|nr:excinuclease ABC subunit UvrC [Planctomycetota bacterium]